MTLPVGRLLFDVVRILAASVCTIYIAQTLFGYVKGRWPWT